MLTHLDPALVCAPFALYSHGVVVEAGSRLLFCSGQLGVSPDDHVPEDAEAQADLCFRNIDAVLSEADMGREDLVRLNAYVTDRAHMAAYMAARDRYVEKLARPPASTLMIVTGFTREIFKVEVEAIAASGQSRPSR
jgi:enamine deaminase RidA (YjgF/YER057c/UK114 family)